MSVQFDTKTMYFVLAVINLTMVLYFTVYMRSTGGRKNLHFFALSKLAQGLAWLFYAMESDAPVWVVTYIADSLAVMGYALESMIFLNFKGRLNKKVLAFYVVSLTLFIAIVLMNPIELGSIRKLGFVVAFGLYIFIAGAVLSLSKDSTYFQKFIGIVYIFYSVSTFFAFLFLIKPDVVSSDPHNLEIICIIFMIALQVIGSVGYLLMVNERDEKLLADTASRDALTGTYNRRAFLEQTSLLTAVAARTASKTCVMMIDIDHFKQVNDKYGHQVGDQTLLDFCKSVGKAIRKADVFARYGGEEFVLYLPNSNIQDALSVARRIRECVEGQGDDGDTINSGLCSERIPRYTFSIGIAAKVPKAADDLNYLINRSDEALYFAKNAGRNCVAGWHLDEEKSHIEILEA